MIISYAQYFAAYFADNLSKKTLEEIQRIVLFGSLARQEAAKSSDVDIFIEIKKKTKKIEQEINSITNAFYQSREALLFKARGIDNKISLKMGNLKEWEDLYGSIASTGIVLYGPYEAKELPSGVQQQIIIYWDKIGKNRGAFLNKIYGFHIGKKGYDGILQKYQGKRLGKSCVILPVQYKKEIFFLIQKHKVHAKILEVFV